MLQWRQTSPPGASATMYEAEQHGIVVRIVNRTRHTGRRAWDVQLRQEDNTWLTVDEGIDRRHAEAWAQIAVVAALRRA